MTPHPSLSKSSSSHFPRLICLGLLLANTGAFAAEPSSPQKAPIKDFVRDTGVRYGAWHSSVNGAGGYIQNVVPCPSNPKRYYSYVDVGGIYRSDDAAASWVMLHGHLPPRVGNYQVRGLLVDPRDDKKILAATGSSYDKEGIYLSNDGGETWKKTLDALFLGNGGNRSSGFIVARHPKNPDIIVAASVGDGVFRSEDNGQTWRNVGCKDLNSCDIRFDWKKPDRLWLCASGGKATEKDEPAFVPGFYRSDDGGTTWTKLGDGAPSEIVQDPVDAGIIYGLFRAELVKRSKDGGTTWEDFSDGLIIEPLEEGKSKPSIAVSAYRALATGPDFILTANTSNSTFFKLKSGESKWERIDKEKVEVGDWFGPQKGAWFFGGALGSITVDPRDPKHWFFTDFFAIYETKDAGKSWLLTINGIEVTVLHCLTQDPSDPGVVHMGQADGGAFTSLDGGQRFHKDLVPDDQADKNARSGGKNMKCIDLSPKEPELLYGVADKDYRVGWTANHVFTSVDRGQTWVRSKMVGLPDMKGRSATTITADLNEPKVAYVTIGGKTGPGEGGVYKSTDAGASWTFMGDGLRPGEPFFQLDIWAHGRQLAAGLDGTLVAISTKANLVVRFDPTTKKWSDVDLKNKGKVWSVVADRLKSGRYFIGVRDDGIYRTDDSGLTWKKVFNKGAAFVATDSVVPGRVAAGTADGVVLSTNGGDSWVELDKNLPYRVYNIPCFAGERLLVGSAGSGIFWMPLSPAGEKNIAAKPPLVR